MMRHDEINDSEDDPYPRYDIRFGDGFQELDEFLRPIEPLYEGPTVGEMIARITGEPHGNNQQEGDE